MQRLLSDFFHNSYPFFPKLCQKLWKSGEKMEIELGRGSYILYSDNCNPFESLIGEKFIPLKEEWQYIQDPTPIFLPDTRNRESFLSLTRLIHFTVRSHSESRILSARAIQIFANHGGLETLPPTVGINLISGCTSVTY